MISQPATKEKKIFYSQKIGIFANKGIQIFTEFTPWVLFFESVCSFYLGKSKKSNWPYNSIGAFYRIHPREKIWDFVPT